MQLIGLAGGMVATYGAIRADLARAVVRAEIAEKSANEAHRRLDGHLTNHG